MLPVQTIRPEIPTHQMPLNFKHSWHDVRSGLPSIMIQWNLMPSPPTSRPESHAIAMSCRIPTHQAG
ncbi:hypothetical protein VTJ04DRAFT_3338 [Mycothermus thermophilus]|uniref:uncharacterized protein n=1 Tax=Humicola insolens TaxID=85995 RepID=UPI00374432C7